MFVLTSEKSKALFALSGKFVVSLFFMHGSRENVPLSATARFGTSDGIEIWLQTTMNVDFMTQNCKRCIPALLKVTLVIAILEKLFNYKPVHEPQYPSPHFIVRWIFILCVSGSTGMLCFDFKSCWRWIFAE